MLFNRWNIFCWIGRGCDGAFLKLWERKSATYFFHFLKDVGKYICKHATFTDAFRQFVYVNWFQSGIVARNFCVTRTVHFWCACTLYLVGPNVQLPYNLYSLRFLRWLFQDDSCWRSCRNRTYIVHRTLHKNITPSLIHYQDDANFTTFVAHQRANSVTFTKL